jgi:hypothetical protein
MALDRFIYFDEYQPKRRRVEPIVKAFFGEWPGKIEWNSDRFFIDIPGTPANSMHRQERFIEVWIGEKAIDVMTRQADYLVNSIARGLTCYIAGALGGNVEDDVGVRSKRPIPSRERQQADSASCDHLNPKPD